MAPAGQAKDGQRLQQVVDGLVGRKGIRHVVAVVADEDGRLLWTGVAGDAEPSGTPLRVDTPYCLTSVTKLYTAATVMRLWERGEVDLEARMTEYLDPALVDGLHRSDGLDRTSAITIEHLLSHTSGLADYFLAAPRGGTSFDALVLERDFAYDVHDVADRVRSLTPTFPPQAQGLRRRRAAYSDTNFQLLGAVIEAVTGLTYAEAIAAEFLDPLGLHDTWCAGQPRAATPRAPASMWVGDVVFDRPLVLRSTGPDGGLVATASDAVRFLRALVTGDAFTRPGTYQRMVQRWNRFGFPRTAAAFRAPSWPIQYGLGILRFRVNRLVAPGLRPTSLVGHTGASGSWLFHCPEHGLCFAGTVDQATAAAVPYRLVPKLLRLLIPLVTCA